MGRALDPATLRGEERERDEGVWRSCVSYICIALCNGAVYSLALASPRV